MYIGREGVYYYILMVRVLIKELLASPYTPRYPLGPLNTPNHLLRLIGN